MYESNYDTIMNIRWNEYKKTLVKNFYPLTFTEICEGFHLVNVNERYVKKDELLLECGKVCGAIIFIIAGSCRQYSVVNYDEKNFLFYFENDFALDYHSFVMQSPSIYSIKAMEDSIVIIIAQQTIQQLVKQNPIWETTFKNIAHSALVGLYKRNEILLTLSPEQRYLKLLGAHPRILQKVPLAKIASFIGITVPSLSRIRKRIAGK